MNEQQSAQRACQAGEALVLGSGPIAHELAAAYRHLGFSPVVGTLAKVPPMRPELIAVADPGIDTHELTQIAQQIGAHVAPSVNACNLAFDRQSLRSTAADELGLPTLMSHLVYSPGELAQAAQEIGFPLVLKQRRGTKQEVLRDEAELDTAALLNPFPANGIVAERYIDFDFEVTILAARSVDPETGQLATWFCEPIGTSHNGPYLTECWQPAPLTEAAMGNARSIAARVTGALECCGVFAIELFVDGEEVYFSQASPLPRLAGMLTRATQRLDQFELQARASLGLPIDATLVSPGAARVVRDVADQATPAALAAAMAVEETGVQVIGQHILVRSTAETVEEARERAGAAARTLEAQITGAAPVA